VDGFDDDEDHWGVAPVAGEDRYDGPGEVPFPWAFVGLALVLVLVVFCLWAGIFNFA